MSRKKTGLLIMDGLLCAVLIALDFYTKRLATARLKDNAAYPLIDGVLELTYLENYGAAFGLMQHQRTFFILIAVLVVCVIAYMLFRMPDTRRYLPMHFLLSMTAAGAVGNMIDRLRHEYVVDFIYFSIINFPVFNVADICVTCSAILFLLLVLFFYKEQDFAYLSIRQKTKTRDIK